MKKVSGNQEKDTENKEKEDSSEPLINFDDTKVECKEDPQVESEQDIWIYLNLRNSNIVKKKKAKEMAASRVIFKTIANPRNEIFNNSIFENVYGVEMVMKYRW